MAIATVAQALNQGTTSPMKAILRVAGRRSADGLATASWSGRAARIAHYECSCAPSLSCPSLACATVDVVTPSSGFSPSVLAWLCAAVAAVAFSVGGLATRHLAAGRYEEDLDAAARAQVAQYRSTASPPSWWLEGRDTRWSLRTTFRSGTSA